MSTEPQDERRCPNCGGTLTESEHQTVCLVNMTSELDRHRAAVRGVETICDLVEANPVGWGGTAVVSLARTVRRTLAPTPSPTARAGTDEQEA